MAKILTAVRSIIAVDPVTGDPTNLFVVYRGDNDGEKFGGTFEFEEPNWTRDGTTLAADAWQKAKDLEEIP